MYRMSLLPVLLSLVACRTDGATVDDIADLQAQIDAVNADADATSATVAAADVRIAALESEDEDHTARIDKIESSLADVLGNTDLTSVADQIDDLEVDLTAAEDDIAANAVAIAGLEATTDGLVDADVAHDDAIDELQTDVSALDARMDSQDAAIVSVQTSTSANTSGIVVLDTRLDAAALDIAALEMTDAALDARLDAMDVTLSSHTSDLSALDGRLDTHGTTLSTHTSDLSALDGRLDAHDTTIAGHTTTLAGQATTISGHTTTLASQATTISGHTTTLASQATTISGHTTTLSGYGTRLTAAEADIGALETDVTDLLADVGDLQLQSRLQRRFFPGNDGADTGILSNRFLNVTKARSNTALRVTYYDNLRVASSGQCTWEVLFNGQRCTAPGAFSNLNYNGNGNNRHIGLTTTGYCTATAAGNLNAGTVSLTVQVTDGADCYTGYNTTTAFLEAQEILP